MTEDGLVEDYRTPGRKSGLAGLLSVGSTGRDKGEQARQDCPLAHFLILSLSSGLFACS